VVAVDVDLADYRAIRAHRNNDLGSGLQGAGKIARVRVNIVHADRIVLRDCGSADSLTHGNTHMFGWRSAKRSQDEHLRIVRIEHIEARPGVVRQALPNNLDDEVLQRRKIAGGFRKFAYFGKNLSEGIVGHASILRFEALGELHEFKCHSVHAITQARRLWAVIEDMCKMGIAALA
jgi:hypothetical protein